MLAFRKALGILVSLIALAGVVVTVVLATRRIDQRPRTDDAYLQADLVHMAPDVSGRIVELDVRDNQSVHKGDVLFRIDPDPYRMRVDQARAAVLGLEATLALTADQRDEADQDAKRLAKRQHRSVTEPEQPGEQRRRHREAGIGQQRGDDVFIDAGHRENLPDDDGSGDAEYRA